MECWVVLSLVFTFLVQLSDDATGSDLWYLDPLLSLVLLIGIRYRKLTSLSHARLKKHPYLAAVTFCTINWLGSMLYELSISESGSSFGGMHTKTLPSFILAQGSYVPLTLWGLFLVYRYQLTIHQLFLVGGMTCAYEAVFFGVPMLLSPVFLLSPMVIAYYFVVYARFIVMGMLLVDERLLWSERQRPISHRLQLFHGLLMGIGCWILFAIWGQAMLYIFDDFETFI